MNSQISLYLSQAFAMSQSEGSTVGATFGLTNLFARSLGGWMSDVMYKKWGVRGRIWALFLQIVAEGILMLIFTARDLRFVWRRWRSCLPSLPGVSPCRRLKAAPMAWSPSSSRPPSVASRALWVRAATRVRSSETPCASTGLCGRRLRPLGWLTLMAGALTMLIHMPGVGSMFARS